MQLSYRIREIRKAYNLTQAEVAYRSDITPSAYGQIERKAGKTKYETLCKIASAISVLATFLIDIDNPNYVENKNKL